MTEDNIEININLTGQAVQGKEKRKERKPWKKRMKNVVLSPFHLFQKLVLRKKRRRHTKQPSVVDNEIFRVAVEEAVESSKKRRRPCYFLFLGLSQSGKSTTISKLFNTERPNKTHQPDFIKIHQNPDVGEGIGIKIVDTPGISGTNSEQDAKIIYTLSSFLRKDLSNRIPTATFLVSRLDGDVKTNSNFIKTLESIAQLKRTITDDHHSNLILLLTHSQYAEENMKKSEITKTIDSYQAAISALFPASKCPVHVMAVENIRRSKGKPTPRYQDIFFEGLQKFAKGREELVLHDLVNWLSQTSKRFSVQLKKELFPISNYLPDYPNPEHIFQKNYKPYFVLYHRDQNGTTSKGKRKDMFNGKLHTSISPESQLVLADKSVIKIEDCLVGDKLLSLDPSCPTVVTRILRMNSEDVPDAVIGTLYCSIERSKTSENEKQLVYTYQNGSFGMIDVVKATMTEPTTSKVVYFIEVETDDGTFVLNGFPCFVRCSEKGAK